MILCISHSNDEYTIDHVMAYFAQHHVKALRINTDQLLKDLSITKTLDVGGWDIAVQSKAYAFSISEVSGVWFRKIWQPEILNEMDEDYRSNVAAELNSTLLGLFQLLEKQVPCINVLSHGKKVEGNKFFQLCQAREVGMLTPDTLITSDFKKVGEFYKKHNQSIIAKLHNALSFSMDAGKRFFPTTVISDQNIGMLEESIAYCPMIFQNKIPKAYELRIIYVDGQCFTGKIDASESLVGQDDWRYAQGDAVFWSSYELPTAEVEKIDQLMKRFSLVFGAIDMICQPNGDYVFLEVNPSGEWGMLQRDLGYPIAETIAKSLLKRIEKYEE